MAELFDLLTKALDDDLLGALGRGETRTAVAAGLPVLLDGLAQHASTPAGADELLDRITTNGGANLDSIAEWLTAEKAEEEDDSDQLVGKILGGGAGADVLGALTSRLGLKTGVAGGLLAALVPIVLGALGKLGGPGGLSPSRLLGLLRDGAAVAADAAPGGREGIASLLGPVAGLGAVAAAAPVDPAVATGSPTTPPATEGDDGRRRAAWWLLPVAVLGGGLIVAFAGGGFGNGDAAPSTYGTTTRGARHQDRSPGRRRRGGRRRRRDARSLPDCPRDRRHGHRAGWTGTRRRGRGRPGRRRDLRVRRGQHRGSTSRRDGYHGSGG